MIEVIDLVKRYGTFTAVDGLTLRVPKGTLYGFLGPNGAGKTTTMRMVTGYLPPSRGRVVIDGCDLLERPIEAKRRIGYLPEHPPVYPELTVRQYLEFVSDVKDVPRSRRRAAVARALDRTSLTDVAGRRISTLSKGFTQRVGLAQAIVHEPPVLFLDEPTSSLDPRQRVEVRDLIAKLRGEHTVVLSTHILPEASEATDRVVIVNGGRVMAIDSAANLSHRLQAREEITLEVGGASAADVRRALAGVPGVAAVQVNASGASLVTVHVASDRGVDVRSDVARVVAARWRLLALRSESLSLEDVFLKLTAGAGADALPPASGAMREAS